MSIFIEITVEEVAFDEFCIFPFPVRLSLFLFVCLFDVCMWVNMCSVCRSENNMEESVLTFHHVGLLGLAAGSFTCRAILPVLETGFLIVTLEHYHCIIIVYVTVPNYTGSFMDTS